MSAARESVGGRLRPVLEIAPGNGEPPAVAIRRLVEHRTWAPSVGLDCRGFYADGRASNLLPELAERLAGGPFPLPVLPVLWPDSPDRLVAEAAAVAAGTGAGAYVRCPVSVGGPDWPAAERLVERARLTPGQADLLLDVGEVAKDAMLSQAIERAVPGLLAGGPEGWRSVTVLAAGWPARRRLPLPPAITVVPRNDAALWTKVQAAVPALRLGFGDFGVRARAALGSGRGSPAPYLRYTVDDTWELRRGPKTPERGTESIQPLCEELLRSAGYVRYGPAFSWGDAEIARAGAHGAGAADRHSPSAWMAWSVSHHLAVVAERLRSGGTP